MSGTARSSSQGEPKVTGLSPMTGPPGTKITIRGENLGLSGNDIIKITINGADCLPYLEWKSSKKIITRCTKAFGQGDIVITTQSGGIGSCDVQFNCHEQTIGPLDESAVWVEEDFKIPEKEKLNISRATDEYSSEISSNRYIPQVFLAQNHSNASLEDLVQLQNSLKAKLSSMNDPEKMENNPDRASLLKQDLPVIMECLQTLERLSKVISSRDTSTDDIVRSIESCRSRVEEFFDPLLAQRDLIHSIESAMQQNETLFKLPSAIDQSIKTKNYDIVVKDISSVLSRIELNDDDQSLIERINKKVSAKIDELKLTIREQVDEYTRRTSGDKHIDEMRRLMSHLQRLGESYDVWKALQNMSRSLEDSLNEVSDKFLDQSKLEHNNLKASQKQDSSEPSSQKKEPPGIVKFIQNAISIFENTYYDFLSLGRSYFDPKDEFSCRESDMIRSERQVEFEEVMVSKPITQLCSLLRAAVVPDSPKLDTESDWPPIDSESYVKWLKEVLDSVIGCHGQLATNSLYPSTQNPIEDFRELVVEYRIESMKRLFENATRENKNLHIIEDWVIEVDDIHGGRTNLPGAFERNVLKTLRCANETIFKPNAPNQKSILKELNVQAEMKGLAQSYINSFTECLDNALISSDEHPAESDRALLASKLSGKAPSKYMNRLLITICNCRFTKDQIFPKLQEEFEKFEGMKMDSVFKNCSKKYHDYIGKISEKFCRIQCSDLSKKLKSSKAYPSRDLQIDLMTVNSQIFLVAPQLVNNLMTRIINSIQVEVNGIQKL